MKVKALDETCKKTREEIDAASKFGEAVVGSVRWGLAVDMDSSPNRR